MALPTRFTGSSVSTSTTVATAATVPVGGIAAGTLVMVSFASWGFGTSTPTVTIADTGSNTWTNHVARLDGTVGVIEHWSCVLATPLVSGDTITVTDVGSGTLEDFALAVDYVTGYTNVGAQATTVATATSTSPTVSLTPAAASSALIYGYLSTMTTAPTITEDTDSAGGDTWHSATKVTTATSGRIVQLGGAFKVAAPAATAQTYNPTLGASTLWEAYLVSYPSTAPIGRAMNINQAVRHASFY